MCGIIGTITAKQERERLTEGPLGLLVHRGPDGKGAWSSHDGRCTLGHRRLAIIDLSEAAAQPMPDATGRFVITYNGEIYNYLEIRADLKGLGISFRTDSDTEVILEAYKQWGTGCLDRFNGMFAFAIYDRPKGILFCARDRYGEKPFLYSLKDDFFAFASEYKALLGSRRYPRTGRIAPAPGGLQPQHRARRRPANRLPGYPAVLALPRR